MCVNCPHFFINCVYKNIVKQGSLHLFEEVGECKSTHPLFCDDQNFLVIAACGGNILGNLAGI